MQFSIIIPVYNCENALRRCVESILAQSFRDYEILLIDDGSTDGSSDLCDSLEKEDGRISAVHKPNGGTSSARNEGLRRAAGDYIAFLDNDDRWIRNDALSIIDERLQKNPVDIICFRTMQSWSEDGDTAAPGNLAPSPAINGDFYADLHSLVKESLYTPAVWSKVVRSSIVRNHNILFPEGKRNEDIDFSCKLLRHANSIDHINECFYCWSRGRENSQSRQPVSKRTADDLLDVITINADYASSLTDEKRACAIEEFLSFPYAVWLTYSNAYNPDELKDRWSTMKRYSHLLKADGDKRAQTVRNAASHLGLPLTRKLVSIATRLKR